MDGRGSQPGLPPLDPTSAPGIVDPLAAREADRSHHMVQFYENDEFLSGVVADYLAAGLVRGEPLVVIATSAHRDALCGRLRALGLDVDRACADAQLVMLDAETTLAQIMDGSMPDWQRFQRTLGGTLARSTAGKPGARVRTYGEMVDVLWRAGNAAAALRLEEMWNELQATHSCALLCAYVIGSFFKEAGDLARVCATHTHVLRTEDGGSGLDRGLLPPTGLPPQHARALAAEIAHRSEIELALRQSLRDQRHTEGELRRTASRAERLLKITAAIADAVTAEQVYEAVVDRVATALEASSAGLWIVQDDRCTTGLVHSVGCNDAANQQLHSSALDAVPSLPVLDAIRGRLPIWIDSQAELLTRYPELAPLVTPGRAYRIACLPIVVSGEVMGALGFTFDDAPAIDEDQRTFLLLVARYSGQALARLRLLDGERRSAVQAEASRVRAEVLYALAASVIRAERIELVFEAALDAIARALGTERASILAFDADGVMRFRAFRGLSEEYRRAVEGHSPWSRNAQAPEPILVPGAAADPTMAGYMPLFEREGIGALGFFPLLAGGKLVGEFMVYYDRPHPFAPQEIEMARAIANHVATAITRFAAIEELQQTVRFNEMFTAILGHDLRNPLGAIMTAAQLALKRGEGERLRKPLSRILNSGERMARMIDQLLDFTRVRVGAGIPLAREPLDLMPLLRHVIDELDDANPDCKLELLFEGETTGSWDSDRLSQVFSNLVANAVQHGVASAGVRVNVDGTSPDGVRVDVHNMGEIPEALLPKLFEPMEGGDRRRDRSRGLGLGLHIGREILKAHGGRIDVRSSEVAGTMFSVWLPRTAADSGGERR